MTENLPIVPERLVDVRTGEMLEPTVSNAARVLRVAREMKAKIQDVIRDVDAYLLAESRRQGTKTFHTENGDVVLTSGGQKVEYDPEGLAQALRAAGCPEERIDEVVVAKVEYRDNRSVLRQLTGANPDYAAAAAEAAYEVEEAVRSSVKDSTTRGRGGNG